MQKAQDAVHVIFDVAFESFPVQLEEVAFWKKIGLNALEEGDFSVMGSAMHKFEPMGMSGFWLLCESHLSFHTWPEEKRVFVDLFSCGDEKRTKRTINSLIAAFEQLDGKIEKKRDVKRGFVYKGE